MFNEFENSENILKIVASNPFEKDCKIRRIVLRRVKIKDATFFQSESTVGDKVFHRNIEPNDLEKWCKDNLFGVYKQICLATPDNNVTYLSSKKGAVKRLEQKTENKIEIGANNRRKKYLLNEGDNIPVFVDLGIFTKDLKVVNSMYDKFKQINRFVEILDDVFKNDNERFLTILDFGCGKSYLTFVIYHYFTRIKNIDVKIIGYDLKADVVDNCNKLARKYGYKDLRFVVADVSKDKLYDQKIDAVVSLHACDVATDYALNYAVKHGAKYIFSVPCCQHEINKNIKRGGDMDVLLKYGIVKERVSALLTDSIRALLLEDRGYSVDVMEFVDIAHSPKNLMIRAIKKHAQNDKNRFTVEKLMQKYQFDQTLYQLLTEER